MNSPDGFPPKDQSQPDPRPDDLGDISQEEADALAQAFFAQFNTPNVTPEELPAIKQLLDDLLLAYYKPYPSKHGLVVAEFQDDTYCYTIERNDQETAGYKRGSYSLVMCPHPFESRDGDRISDHREGSIVFQKNSKQGIVVPGHSVKQAYLSPLPNGARKSLDFDEIFGRIQAGRISHQDGDKTQDSWTFEEYSEHDPYKTTPLPCGPLGPDTDSQ